MQSQIMLTPAFSIQQDGIFLTFLIKAPLAKVSDAEIYIEDNDFIFHSKPYYLRLHLPGSLIEDDRTKAKYESDEGRFVVQVAKATQNEHFEGLDMLTKLLTAPKVNLDTRQPLIEVLDDGSEATTNAENQAPVSFSDGDSDDEEVDSDLLNQQYGYGFAEQRSGVFKSLQGELAEVIEIKNPDSVPLLERVRLRMSEEQVLFSDDHYLADLFEEDAVNELIHFTPEWEEEYKLVKQGKDPMQCVDFSKEEEDLLRSLPRKEYLLDTDQKMHIFFGLLDIIFAYAYNCRSTEGENTVESGWTINRLSATLSWLQRHGSVKETLVSCFRRCLVYPLHRNWKLSHTVFQDVKTIISLGPRRVLKCLLQVHRIFSHSYPCYVLNDLYITDYCVWIQHVTSEELTKLADKLALIDISKDEVGFDLDLLEDAASGLLEEHPHVDQLTGGIHQLNINTQQTTCKAETSDSSSEDSSDETDSSSNGSSSEEDKEEENDEDDENDTERAQVNSCSNSTDVPRVQNHTTCELALTDAQASECTIPVISGQVE